MDKRGRIWQLDAIRGALAIGVTGYHLDGWPEAFGTWGVYAFFVLSGWALDHVYRERFELRSFVVARIARLAPLWVPVVLVSVAMKGITDPGRIALNLTGLFGFIQPGATSVVEGGWSIGIEVVCYAMFPLLVRLSRSELVVVFLVAAVVRFGWVGGLMPADLTAGWVPYTQYPSFAVFFIGGMLCSRLGLLRPPEPVFDPERPSRKMHRLADVLGDASYGTYLLHPILASVIGPLALVVTVPLAWVIRRAYEVPAGRFLRHLVADHPRRGVRSSGVGSGVPEHGLAAGDGVRP